MSFGRFPSQWVKSSGLLAFSARAGRPGEQIAALKLYLAAAAYSDFTSWTATLSLSALEDVTGLSRPMLIKGSELLREKELVSKGLSGQTSTYRLTPGRLGSGHYFPPLGERPTWAKVPQDIIEKRLHDIPNRGRIPLSSLRLYILFLTMRNNDTSVTNISYRKMSDYTGVRLADISKGVQILMISDFLRVVSAYDDETGHYHNTYMLLGDFVGKVRRRIGPKSHNPTSSIVIPF